MKRRLKTMAFTREQVRDSIERAGDAHWQALIRHHTEAYPESRPTPGDVARAEAERLNDLGLGNNPNSSWWRAGSSRFPPQYASPTFSRIAPKAPDSKPSRSLATTEPLGDLDLVEGRGGALPDGALARRTSTPDPDGDRRRRHRDPARHVGAVDERQPLPARSAGLRFR
jgi:hypothetical protein